MHAPRRRLGAVERDPVAQEHAADAQLAVGRRRVVDDELRVDHEEPLGKMDECTTVLGAGLIQAP